MRKPLVAGNWKMNKTVEQATLLVADLLPGLQQVEGVDKVLCPPYTALMVVSQMLAGTAIALGAQNMYWEESGAFTGEISPFMVKELCQYVIIGHSERRAYFSESNETVNKKVKAAFASGLIPIVCVGETLEQNEKGETSKIIENQVLVGLKEISTEDAKRIIVAYEPVWAIGTGKAASPQIANQIIAVNVRASLAKMFGEENTAKIRVLYGGSVKSTNAADFFKEKNIDGALVGGASLKADEFVEISKAAII